MWKQNNNQAKIAKYDVMKFFGTMKDMPPFDEVERETDEEE